MVYQFDLIKDATVSVLDYSKLFQSIHMY